MRGILPEQSPRCCTFQPHAVCLPSWACPQATTNSCRSSTQPRRCGPPRRRLLVCRPGCTQCCHGTFAINELDAARLRAGMSTLRSEQPNLAAAIERRARAWLAKHGSDFPAIRNRPARHSEADRDRFEDFANEEPCPALDPATGLCDIYEWRPMTCRVFGPPIRMAGPDARISRSGRGRSRRKTGRSRPLRTLLHRRNSRPNRRLRDARPARIGSETPQRDRLARRNRRRLCAAALISGVSLPSEQAILHSAGGAQGSASSSKSNLRKFTHALRQRPHQRLAPSARMKLHRLLVQLNIRLGKKLHLAHLRRSQIP